MLTDELYCERNNIITATAAPPAAAEYWSISQENCWITRVNLSKNDDFFHAQAMADKNFSINYRVSFTFLFKCLKKCFRIEKFVFCVCFYFDCEWLRTILVDMENIWAIECRLSLSWIFSSMYGAWGLEFIYEEVMSFCLDFFKRKIFKKNLCQDLR